MMPYLPRACDNIIAYKQQDIANTSLPKTALAWKYKPVQQWSYQSKQPSACSTFHNPSYRSVLSHSSSWDIYKHANPVNEGWCKF